MGSVFDNNIKVDASGNATITGNLTVTGTTTTISTTNTVISDKLIELANGTSGTPSGDSGLVIERGSSNNVFIGWDESEDKVTVATGTFTGASTGDLSLTDAALKTGAITASGNITTTGEFVIGSASINENDLESIDGITAGTVAASKAAIVDSNKDITGFRNITLTGELDAASLDISGGADIDGTLEAAAITVGGTPLNTVIAGVTVGSATTATNITVADESSDTTCFPIFATGASGDLAPKSGSNLTFNSSSGLLTATQLAGTLTTAAQTNITTVGTLSTLTVDDITINGSTISDTGDLDVDCGGNITLDADGGTITFSDGGSSLGTVTSSGFTGDVVGNVTGNVSGTAATVTGSAQTAITSVGSLTSLAIDNNVTNTSADTYVAMTLDFDKTGASTSDNDLVGIFIDMDNTTAEGGTNTMTGALITPTLTHAQSSGTTLVKGIEITATGSGPGNTTTRALDLTATGADFNQGVFMKIDNGGPDIKMLSSANNADFATISTGANGELTIATTDGSGTAGHVSVDADGDITLDADGGTITFADAGSSLGTITSSGYSGTSAVATTVTVADESSDTACNVLFATAATGNLAPKSGTNLTFNSSNGTLTASEFSGGGSAITGLDGSNIGSGTVNAARMAAAQTAITSIHATDLIIGEDAQTAIDFGTADEIDFKAANAVQLTLSDGVFRPQTDSDVDLGTSSLYFKDAFIDKITTSGNIELGHASDTTISRTGAGAIAVEGTAVLLAGAQTAVTTDFNTGRKVGRDADNLVDFSTDDEIKLRVNGADLVSITGGSSLPNVSATATSGTNQNGKSITVGGGLGTGTGVPGSVEIASGIPTSSGSNAHTATPVAIFDAFGVTSNFGGIANLANDTGVGEVVFFGTEDSGQNAEVLAAGRVVYLKSDGVWEYADADTEAATNSLIGIALGDSVGAGILLKGFFKLNSYIEGSFAKGAPCFVSENAGSVDFVKPSAAGDHVRILGYGTATTNVIYFNPSSTTLTL